MDKRVGQHCSVILELIRQVFKKSPERAIVLHDAPRYADIVKNGTGFYFHDPRTAKKEDIIKN
jgi:hypothetical protein